MNATNCEGSFPQIGVRDGRVVLGPCTLCGAAFFDHVDPEEAMRLGDGIKPVPEEGN